MTVFNHLVAASLRKHRQRLRRVVEGARHVGAFRSMYRDAQQQLSEQVDQRDDAEEELSVYRRDRVDRRTREAVAALIALLLAAGMRASREVAEESLRSLGDVVGTIERARTGVVSSIPMDDPGVFQAIVSGRSGQIRRMYSDALARFGTDLIQQVRVRLNRSMLDGETVAQAIKSIASLFLDRWWMVERILRTELSWAVNASLRDGMLAMSGVMGGRLWCRWVELCDDSSFPLDDRVAVDSIAIHAQVTPVAGGVFTMPATAPWPDARGHVIVPASLVGGSWKHPPNRPNDRSVLEPWLPEWGSPGWLYRDGNRVGLTEDGASDMMQG